MTHIRLGSWGGWEGPRKSWQWVWRWRRSLSSWRTCWGRGSSWGCDFKVWRGCWCTWWSRKLVWRRRWSCIREELPAAHVLGPPFLDDLFVYFCVEEWGRIDPIGLNDLKGLRQKRSHCPCSPCGQQANGWFFFDGESCSHLVVCNQYYCYSLVKKSTINTGLLLLFYNQNWLKTPQMRAASRPSGLLAPEMALRGSNKEKSLGAEHKGLPVQK